MATGAITTATALRPAGTITLTGLLEALVESHPGGRQASPVQLDLRDCTLDCDFAATIAARDQYVAHIHLWQQPWLVCAGSAVNQALLQRFQLFLEGALEVQFVEDTLPLEQLNPAAG